tara:strand:- start:1115 stop:1291 length:177 start_codon:yes stop_codon:yes gene_type:complete
MSKYVERIMDEVYDNFRNHFDDKDEKIWFLEELIRELQDELEDIKYQDFGGTITDDFR